MESRKILGRRAYGSIPHLPSSRIGTGDHFTDPGQARICCEQTRDEYDFVIVQEKLDGSCVSVAKVDGTLYPLIRAGWPAMSSQYEQHHLFDSWVWQNKERFDYLLFEGERVVGEWLAQAHGTRYELRHEPFVAFDIMRPHPKLTGVDIRLPFKEFVARCEQASSRFETPTVLAIGSCPVPISTAMSVLGWHGQHGAQDKCEGVVYRVERRGKVDFLAKYVRHDKEDGCYLPCVTGKEPVWNWRPERRPAQETIV